MVEVGAPDECIEEMRSFLHLEGWSQHKDILPKGWMLRIDENSCDGAGGKSKCSLMRDDGGVFEDWLEGLNYLESLGGNAKSLKEMILRAEHVETNGRENDSKTIVDNVKNEQLSEVDDTEVSLANDTDKSKAGSLPKGWWTRNTLGNKGFRIYSPPGF